MSRIDLGFPSGAKRKSQPYEMSFRCDQDTIKHLEYVKNYLDDVVKRPAENTSEVVREAVKFGSIWCRQTQIAFEEANQKREMLADADKKMEELVDAEKKVQREAKE